MKNKNSAIVLTAFITFIVTSAMYLGSYILFPDAHAKLGSVSVLPGIFEKSDQLDKVKKLINENYIEVPDKEKLDTFAIKSYVAGLGDPYSEYYTKSEYENILADLVGNYNGIGVEVSVTDSNEIIIVTVYRDAPADKAGIIAGDIILAVDGKKYSGDEMDSVISAIRSAKKSVLLDIKRNEEILKIEVAPDKVELPCAESEMLSEDVGYIHLMNFFEDADEVFRTHVNTLLGSGAKSLIIDLRDNPGGMLTTVVDIADLLLPEGNILTIKSRNGEKEEFVSGETYLDIPLYVLINGGSASASEVLAGALRDHKRAVLIGETSFGKGLVQSMFNLDDGAALKLTVSKYYTPSGTCIDGTGIKPDHEVVWETNPDYVYNRDDDVQLKKALELIKGK